MTSCTTSFFSVKAADVQKSPQACTAEIDAQHQNLQHPFSLTSEFAELLKCVHSSTARPQAQPSLKGSASACRTEVVKRVDDVIGQLQLFLQQLQRSQQGILKMCLWLPCEEGGPEQLQEAVHASNVEVIRIIMEGLENEHEYL